MSTIHTGPSAAHCSDLSSTSLLSPRRISHTPSRRAWTRSSSPSVSSLLSIYSTQSLMVGHLGLLAVPLVLVVVLVWFVAARSAADGMCHCWTCRWWPASAHVALPRHSMTLRRSPELTIFSWTVGTAINHAVLRPPTVVHHLSSTDVRPLLDSSLSCCSMFLDKNRSRRCTVRSTLLIPAGDLRQAPMIRIECLSLDVVVFVTLQVSQFGSFGKTGRLADIGAHSRPAAASTSTGALLVGVSPLLHSCIWHIWWGLCHNDLFFHLRVIHLNCQIHSTPEDN